MVSELMPTAAEYYLDKSSPPLTIIITNDYEIMGNGRGDVDKILIQPTDEILKVCNKYYVPHTLFVDVMEYNKFTEAEEKGWLSPTYDAGSKIRTQLHRAVDSGHDVQLHIHPQWIDAQPVQDDFWRVNFDYWRLPNVPGGLGTIDDPVSLRGMIALGKQTLERLIRPKKPDYACIAFRAGGYCIQPEKDVLAVLRELGFLIESSVSTGRAVKQEHTQFDFRSAPKDMPYWPIAQSVTEAAENGDLIEIPIFTNKVAPRILRSAPKRPDMIIANVADSPRRRSNIGQRIQSFLVPKRMNFDFCKLSAKELIHFTQAAHKRYGRIKARVGEIKYPGTIPVVMTGHSKEWGGSNELEKYLEWASGIDWIQFSTFPAWVASLREGGCVDLKY